MNVGFVSLGCSKNLVVTEQMIGIFKDHGFNIVSDESTADVIVINTCGFIESAKQEAIDAIFEMAKYKEKRCKYLIVTGCLVQRYKDELEKLIKEVDLFIAINEYKDFWKKVSQLVNKEEFDSSKLDYNRRVLTTGKNMAYLKIAEGCDNKCTFCAIPHIQGPYISRKMEDIIEEAKHLAKDGIKEIIVIAQDTTKYGIDIYGKPMLAKLLEKLCEIEEIDWIRFLYSYPETITDELIKVVKENNKICKYFDIPIQHISDKVLKRMNRKSNGESIRKLVKKIREEIPEVILRTTVMVGFPGETKEQFEELYDFIKETKFNKLGAFKYSKEDGTPAAKLDGTVHSSTKISRYNKIMKLQQQISKNKLEQLKNKKYKVLIESKTFDEKYYIGRTYMDVPEMDGLVFIKNNGKIKDDIIGTFKICEIIDIREYDLIAKFE